MSAANTNITLWLRLRELQSHLSYFHSDVCVGQSQDDSIVGMKQSKQIPPALPVSGNLSSSNPDLLQSHHRILDFNNQPGAFSRCHVLMCDVRLGDLWHQISHYFCLSEISI